MLKQKGSFYTKILGLS